MKSICIGLGVLAVLAMLGSSAHAADKPAPVPAKRATDSERKSSAELRATCANNLKQLGLVFKMFANENKGARYPALSAEPGRLMFANEGIGANPVYPEYVSDLSILICPAGSVASLLEDPAKTSDPKVMIDDHSYFYLGYAVMSDADVAAFAKAYKERVAKGLKMDEDLTAPKGSLYLLREGIERFFITDINVPSASAKAQSSIPVLIERPENHEPAGGNVLYLDGHVEFLRYADNGKWPMTKATIDALKALDALKPPAK